MTFTRKLISLDVESTGVDVAKDRIISLAMVEYGYVQSTYQKYFNPGVKMTPENIECHGITNEFLEDKPPFKVHAKEIHMLLTSGNPVQVGFNLMNFDIPIIWEELNRAGIQWDLSKTPVIDVGNIFKKKEERTLTAAVKFYCGRSHDGAHDAVADAGATLEVLLAQVERYDELSFMDETELATFSKFDDRVDLAGKLVRNKDGVVCYNFGKNKGVPVKDDVGYGRWMLSNDFSQNTKNAVAKELNL